MYLHTLCSQINLTRCLDEPNAKFGEALRGQVEERLNFFEVSNVLPLIPVSQKLTYSLLRLAHPRPKMSIQCAKSSKH